jgi:hypothetical protein
VIEKHHAEALYSAVKSLIHTIWTKDKGAQQVALDWMIQITKPRTIRWWSELKLANGKPLIWIWKQNTNLIDLRWNDEEQGHLKTLVERYTLRVASGVWKVHRWELV